ncbi:MAG: hypothetical protein MJ117_10115, partial [Lachnospiraceae bacterium]|nr:hypothetical protein [Lachnospiraceae bacterium]
MKKRRMKLLALFLSCSMTVGMITPVSAEPVEQEVELAAMQEESVAGEDTSDETVTAEDAIAENAGTEAEDEINETVSGEEEVVEDTAEETKEEKKESATAVEKTIEKIVTVLEEQKSKPALTSETEEAKTQAISVSVLNSEGVASGMYSMENAIITKQEDGSYLLRMHQSRMNRNYMAIVADQTDESKNAATNHEVDWYIGGGDDGYWYVIPVASLDTPVYASFSNTANVEAGKDWSNIMTVVLDAESCTATDAADVTAAEMNIRPAVEPEKETRTQAITVSVLNSEGAPSGMYSMENAIITKQEDGSYLLKMHQSRMNRNYMAIVADQTDESKNAATNHEVDWYIGGGDDGYWYVIPVASLDTPVYVSFSNTANVEAGKDWSNIMTVVLDAESCTATEAADVMAEEMNIDPAKPADPEDPEKDPEEDPKEDPEKDPEEDPKDDPEKEPEKNVPADGTYTATATTGVAMFKVVDSVLTVKNGKMEAVVTLSGTGYDYLYMGTKEEAYAAQKSDWIPAVVNSDGQYTYKIPVAALDTPLAVASRSARYASDGKGVDAWINRTITIESASLKAVSKDPEKDP